MLNCRQMAERATDYLERKLGWRELPGYLMHLAMCPGCRAYLAQFRVTIRLIAGLPIAETPSSRRDAILSLRAPSAP